MHRQKRAGPVEQLDRVRAAPVQVFDEDQLGGQAGHQQVVDEQGRKSPKVYFLNRGDNILKMPSLPKFKSFELSTYGGASSGSTRVGLKIKL